MMQKEIIKNYIASTGWIHEYRVRGIQTDWGFIGARGDRDVRQMIKDGILEKKLDGKYCVVRVKPTQPVKESTQIPIVGTVENEKVHWRPEFLKQLQERSQKALL